MNASQMALLFAALLVVSGCQSSSENFYFKRTTLQDGSPEAQLPQTDLPRKRNGKLRFAAQLPELYAPASLDSLPIPVIDERLELGLKHQLRALRNWKNHDPVAAAPDFSPQRLEEAIRFLLDRAGTQPQDMHYFLDAWQVWGSDRKGHVRFTGYYTPILKAKRTPDEVFKYPIYAFPENWEGRLPTRREIDGEGALEGMGLELAYLTDPVDIYYMQMQGSGILKFVDTRERVLFKYAGRNGYRFRGIDRVLIRLEDARIGDLTPDGVKRFFKRHPELRDSILFTDPSYVFFRPGGSVVRGAAGVPLLEEISIAADPRYFPIGSVVLAEVPVYDRSNNIVDHEYRIFLPQDVGGAVKGPGHVDIYCGIGEAGKRKASMYHHYGRMWVLLPKDRMLALR